MEKNNFKIELTKGNTYAIAIKFKNISEDLRSAYFTVKENPDESALLQKTLGTGISKIDDRAYKNEKTYKIQIQPIDTSSLEVNVQYLYDCQVTIGNVVKTIMSGFFVVRQNITGLNSVVTPEIEVVYDNELEVDIETTPATNGVEYEQDPVSCAKIGDITTLTTTEKTTIVGAVNEVKSGVNSNLTEITKIENGTISVPSAVNVANKINDKNITDIFESNGITAKSSTDAINVTGKINNHNITDIFESDGITAKNSTSTQSLNGVQTLNGRTLVVNDTIIPYKKLLWSGSINIFSTGGTNYSTIPVGVNLANKKLCIDVKNSSGQYIGNYIVGNLSSDNTGVASKIYSYYDTSKYYIPQTQIKMSGTNLIMRVIFVATTGEIATNPYDREVVSAVYEIID